MTFENNLFDALLIKNGFTLRNTNKSDEPSHKYRLYQKDNIWIDFFAGWCTIYRKKKTIYSFELCTDRCVTDTKFQYKQIPKEAVNFLTSLPAIHIPNGVSLVLEKDITRKISKALRYSIMNKCNNQCLSCGNKEKLAVDHIFPISKGGPTVIENLQILCRTCNLKKSNKLTLL